MNSLGSLWKPSVGDERAGTETKAPSMNVIGVIVLLLIPFSACAAVAASIPERRTDSISSISKKITGFLPALIVLLPILLLPAQRVCALREKRDMRLAVRIIACLLLSCGSLAGHAQVPFIIGTWKLNVELSKFPGPAPQVQVRSYRLTDNGVIIGVAVTIDTQGRPNFLQFAARVDGKDYPEFNTESAARYLIDRSVPPRTYAEIPTSEPRKVRWVDKVGGKILFSGAKWVSEDGNTMSFTLDTKNDQGGNVEYLYVFDRTGS